MRLFQINFLVKNKRIIWKSLTRDESRNPRLKAEGNGPMARLFFPSVFSLQSIDMGYLMEMTAGISCFFDRSRR